MNHEYFMKRCIELARMAKQRGDSPVGSIIVQDNKIIGEGIEGGKTHKDITFHAEIEAIRQATKFLDLQKLTGCMLYTTHEPCIMCSYVIRFTAIPTIVIGILTGETGGFSSRFPLLVEQGINKWANPPAIIHGILAAEVYGLHQDLPG